MYIYFGLHQNTVFIHFLVIFSEKIICLHYWILKVKNGQHHYEQCGYHKYRHNYYYCLVAACLTLKQSALTVQFSSEQLQVFDFTDHIDHCTNF